MAIGQNIIDASFWAQISINVMGKGYGRYTHYEAK